MQCIHVCKCRNETCWNSLKDRGGRIKENVGGIQISIVGTFVNATVYPQHNNKKILKINIRLLKAAYIINITRIYKYIYNICIQTHM
jgi:hypothetical protein